jgi:hypothetical protein
MIDPLGTDYALSPGRDGTQDAGRVPAVAVIMRDALARAQYVWLAGGYNHRRIAWTPALHAYFTAHFTRILTDSKGDALYVRRGPGSRAVSGNTEHPTQKRLTGQRPTLRASSAGSPGNTAATWRTG